MTVEALDVQFSVAECETVCMSVPDAAIVGELVALLTTLTVPSKLPDIVELKSTPKVVLCPAAKVNGGVKPLTLKPAATVDLRNGERRVARVRLRYALLGPSAVMVLCPT